MKIITLLTDLGYDDPFVGEMKGVIYKINPEVQIVDITHNIPMGDIEKAAFFLSQYYRYFTEGTIHIVVVDPGVGGERAPVVFSEKGHYFIGPDNGVFSLIFNERTDIHIIENLIEGEVSSTFHGRDIFAPAGAWISKGKEPKMFGKVLPHPVKISFPKPILQENYIIGEVIYIDHFGNITTNIPGTLIKGDIELVIEGKTIKGHYPSYDSVPMGEPLLIINSFGYLEIAVNAGNASKTLSLARHSSIKIRRFYG